MFEFAYVVLHDNGKEYNDGKLGFVIGVFSDDAQAKLALMQKGYNETDRFGNYWKGRDRAWIVEVSTNKLLFDL